MPYIIRTVNDVELYHHGILGMKWGVRRYQNPDGTLTPAGQKRADQLADEVIRRDNRIANIGTAAVVAVGTISYAALIGYSAYLPSEMY